MQESVVKYGVKQLAILFLALVFLFETWVWGSMVAAARVVAAFIPWTRFQTWARGVINGLPAIVAVLLFGVPLFVSEFGAFISVVLMATGHLLIGGTMYIALKIVGVGLIPVIFDVTREKLMTLPWFVFLYEQFERLHAMAKRFVARPIARRQSACFGGCGTRRGRSGRDSTRKLKTRADAWAISRARQRRHYGHYGDSALFCPRNDERVNNAV
jgi:hypothetical protein